MAKKISEVVLQYKVDDASLSKAQSSLARLAGNIKTLGTNAQSTAQILDGLGGAADELGKTKAALDIAKQFAQMDDSIGNARQRAILLLKTLQDIGTSSGNIEQAISEFNKLTEASSAGGSGLQQSIFSKVQRAAGGVGLGGVANVAGFADDFSDLAGALQAAGIAVGPLVAALAPLAAVVGVAGIAIAGFVKGIQDGSKQIDDAIKQLDAYYNAIGDGTTESINKQIDAINKQKNIDQQYAEQIQRTLDTLRGGGALDRVGEILFKAAGGADGLQKKADELSQKIKSAELETAGLTAALDSSQVAMNDNIQAVERRAEAEKQALEEQKRVDDERERTDKELQDKLIDQQADGIRRRIELDKQLDDLKAKGSAKDVAEEAQRVNQLAIAREKELNALYALSNQTPQTQKRIQDLETELADLDYEASRLEGDIKKVTDARQAELDAYNALKKSVNDLTAGMNNAAGRASSLAKGVLDAIGKAGEDRLKAETKAAEDITKINEQASERKADLEKRYADNLVSITQNAADSAAKALQKLQQTQADLRRDLGRADEQATRKLADDNLTAQIDAQREETQSLQDHLRNLQKIRQDAQDREFELAANRDFAGLFFSRRDTNKQLDSANSDFNAERQQRNADLQAKLADNARQFAIEARERQIQFQQKLADNRTQYQRELADIEANRQQQLARTRAQYAADQAELSANLAKQLAARRAAYRLELDEINKAVALRIKAEINAQSAFVNGAIATKNIIGSLFGAITSGFGKPVKRDIGGDLRAMQLASINEPTSSGNESWLSGGKRYAFPGPGLFLPSQAGYVDSGRGSGNAPMNVTIPITVNGAGSPQATAQAIRKELAGAIQQIIKR